MSVRDNASLARPVFLGGLLLALLIYIPGLSGGFVFDDYPNILQNEDLRATESESVDFAQSGWSGRAGPLKRPLAMISFALNFATTGEFVGAFKITNLAIHLVNGILVFVLFRLLLMAHGERREGIPPDVAVIAAVAAVIWMVHPLNLTSVVYIVQRMTSLSALFSLAAMIFYCIGRRRLARGADAGWKIIIAGVPICVTLGMLCKENAILTIPLIALIEVCFFRLRTARPSDRSVLVMLFVGFIALPLVLAVGFVLIEPDFLASRFVGRPFTMHERLLTEARVLWFYLGQFLLPRLSEFGIYHDDFLISRALFDPPRTFVAVLAISAVAFVSAATIKRYPLVTFAVWWYLIGHAMESSVIALELVHEHRNYVPILGIVLALTYGAAVVGQKYLRPSLLRFGATMIIALFAMVTFIRAGDWSDPGTLALIEAERHPTSFRSVFELARIQFGLYKLSQDEEDYRNSLRNLERASELDPSAKRPLASLLKLEYAHGNPPKPEWKEELLHRYRNTLFHASETLDLHQMVKCRANKSCAIPPNVIVELFGAALANPTIPDYSKAQLMVDLAVFFINEAGELDPAIHLLDSAIELAPAEFGFRKVRVQTYAMAGKFAVAEREIAAIRNVKRWDDEVRSPVEDIADLERLLATARDDAARKGD
mgnify:FL=1